MSIIIHILLAILVQYIDGERTTCPVRGEFSSRIFPVNAEFWKSGVEHSRVMLDRILEKISKFETSLKHRRLYMEKANLLRSRLAKRGVHINPESQLKVALNHASTCSEMVQLGQDPDSMELELELTCAESEQLHAMAYQRLFEPQFCRNERLLQEMLVAWDVCLAHHYPWIPQTSTDICIVRSKYGEFVACYCNLQGPNHVERSFCISKPECWRAGVGVYHSSEEFDVSEDCMEQMNYLMEGGYADRATFQSIQHEDKLRPRGPYSQHSPCHGRNFTGLFDVGQIIVEDLDNQIEILSYLPDLEDRGSQERFREPDDLDFYFDDQSWSDPIPRIEPEDPGGLCGLDEDYLVDEAERSFYLLKLKERIIVNFLITFLFGIPYGYILNFFTSERSWKVYLSINIIQVIMITLKLVELLYFASTWRSPSILFSSQSFYLINIFSLGVLVVSMFLVEERLVNFVWRLSFASLVVDLAVISLLDMFHITLAMLFYQFYLFLTLVTTVNTSISWEEGDKSTRIHAEEKSPQTLRRVNRKQLKLGSRENGWSSENFINCYKHITDRVSSTYIEVSCKAKCMIRFHKECWVDQLKISNFKSDISCLKSDCLVPTCSAIIVQISWYHGRTVKGRIKYFATHTKLSDLDVKPAKFKSTGPQPPPPVKSINNIKIINKTKSDEKGSQAHTNKEIQMESLIKQNKPQQGSKGIVRCPAPGKDIIKPKLPVGMPVKKKKKPKLNIDISGKSTEQYQETDHQISSTDQIINSFLETASENFHLLGASNQAQSKFLPLIREARMQDHQQDRETQQSYRDGGKNFNSTTNGQVKTSNSCELSSTDFQTNTSPSLSHNAHASSLQRSKLSPLSQRSKNVVTHRFGDDWSAVPQSRSTWPNLGWPASGLADPRRMGSATASAGALNSTGEGSISWSSQESLNSSQDGVLPTIRQSGGQSSRYAERPSPVLLTSLESLQQDMMSVPELHLQAETEDDLSKELSRLDSDMESLEKESSSSRDSVKSPHISPLAAILRKNFPECSADQVETSIRSVLDRSDTQNLTLDQFRCLVSEDMRRTQEGGQDSEILFDSADEEEEIDECAICTESLILDTLKVRPCLHTFHSSCIKQWFKKEKTCPTCRSSCQSISP